MKISPDKMETIFNNSNELKDDDVGENWLEGYINNDDGNLKEGRIAKIDDEFVYIDLQQKAESKMPIDEIKDENGNLLFKQGDAIVVLLQKKAGAKPSYQKAKRYLKTQEEIKRLGNDYKDAVVEGIVTKKNRGGLLVLSNGVEYFMPRGESAIKNEDKFIGKKIKACIIDVRKESNSIVISKKRYLTLNSEIQKSGAVELVNSGLVYDGVIKNIMPFGMTIEIGNIDGFLHRSEMSYKHGLDPQKTYKVGDVIKVKPIEYNEEKNRLSLSIKAMYDDPWSEVEKQIKVGYVLQVVVSNIESYGAFVDLGNDVEGFLHISEISWDKNVKNVNDYLTLGQEINVEVIEIDSKNKRLRVSLKNQLEKPFTAYIKQHKVGDIIKGKIANLMPFGAFVNLSKGVDGLLHDKDAFWDRDKKCSDTFKVGDEIQAKIDRIDTASERISLSYKYNTPSPIDMFAKKYNIDDVIKGKVIDIKEFGVFIKVDGDDIDALIKNEDLAGVKKEELKIGDELEGALLQIDKKYNKVRVSMRRLERKKKAKELEEYNSKDKMTLGDALKGKLIQK